MNEKMKKGFVCLLALVLVLLCLPTTVFAAESGTCGADGDNLTWTLDDSGTLTIFGTGTMNDYISSNRAPWYDSRNDITSVEIKDGVTSIGIYAFDACSSMTEITIPNSVTTIGKVAFADCDNLTTVTLPNRLSTIEAQAFLSCNALREITIPESVTTIGQSAFYGCTKLKSVTIPESVTSIGAMAFQSCSSLTSVTIGDGVTSIGNYAFAYCTSLTEITIPNSVTTIGSNAFNSCTSLTSVTMPCRPSYTFADTVTVTRNHTYTSNVCCGTCGAEGDNLKWTLEDGTLTISGTGAMAEYYHSGYAPWYSSAGSITSVEIKAGVTSIGAGAFRKCAQLASISIPDCVTSIGYYAFDGCTALESVTIPDGVTLIDSGLFYDCTALESVTIPNGVTSIKNNAFDDCSSLASITIPASVTSIENSAFYGCTELTSITIPGSVTSIGADAFADCANLTSVTVPCAWKTNPVYTEFDTTKVAFTYTHNYATAGCCGTCGADTNAGGVESVKWTLDGGKLTISGTGKMADYAPGGAPWYSSGITSVKIEDGVTSIGDYTFCECASLTSVTLADTVTSIGEFAFGECTSLVSINIPESVTTIGERAFYNCSSLTEITIPGSVSSIGDGAFLLCTSLTKITIGNGVSTIGVSAFGGCSSLTSVIFPDSVTTIGRNAFACCSQLAEITIPVGMTAIGQDAFQECILNSVNIPCVWRNNKQYHFEENVLVRYHGPIDPATGLCSYGCGTDLAVAKVDEVYYSDFDTAVSKWGANSTLTLLDRVTTDGIKVSGSGMILDLNDYSLTLQQNLFTVAGGSLTIRGNGNKLDGRLCWEKGIIDLREAENVNLFKIICSETLTAPYESILLPVGYALKGNNVILDKTAEVRPGIMLLIITCPHNSGKEFVADGSQLNCVCSPCGKVVGTATVNAKQVSYSGAAVYPATVETTGAMDAENRAITYTKNSTETTPINVGTYTASITVGGKTASTTFEIIKSATAFSGGIGVEESTLTYGDSLTITVKPIPSGAANTFALAEADMKASDITLWLGDTQLTAATVTVNSDGTYTVTYDTLDKGLAIGPNELTVKFGGNENMEPAEEDPVQITLNKAQPKVTWDDSMIVTFGEKISAPKVELLLGDGTYGGTIDYCYKLDDGENVPGLPTNAGTYEVTAFVSEDIYYSDEMVTAIVTIQPKPVEENDIVISGVESVYTYTGTAIEPAVTVSVGGVALTTDDYTVTYGSNTNVPQGGSVTVTLKRNYAGENSVSFAIDKADATVAAAPTPRTLTYNGDDQALIMSGEAKGGTMLYSLDNRNWSETIPTGTDAGSYTVYYKVEGDANHTDTQADSITVTVAPKTLTPYIGGSMTKSYDGTDVVPAGHSLTVELNGIEGSDNVLATADFAYAGADAGTTTIQATNIQLTGSHSGNYVLSTTTVSGDAGQIKPLDITTLEPHDWSLTMGADLTYNGKEQTKTVESITACGLDVTFDVTGNTGTDAGDYTLAITANGNFTGSAYIPWNIARKDIADAAITLGKTLTYNGEKQTQTVQEVKVDGLTVTFDVTGNENTNAGDYTLTVAGNGNFTGEATADWSIAKAPLTVTAMDSPITYGDAPAFQGVTYSGFVTGEDAGVLGGQLTCSCIYTQYGDAGTYPITPGGLTANNYAITFVDGTLTVKPKTVTVTADAKAKTYGDKDPELTYTVTGLVNGDQLTGTLARAEGEDAGTYAIQLGTLTANSNYTLRYAGAKLTVNKRNLTLTAKDQTVLYGGDISDTAFTAEGLLEGHSVSISLIPSTINVTLNGTITVSVSNISVNNIVVTDNYSITCLPGKLVVQPDASKIAELTAEKVTSADAEAIKAVQEMMASADTEGIDEATKKTWDQIAADAAALMDVIEAAQAAPDTGNTETVKDVTAENVKAADKEALASAKADLEQALEDYSSNYTEEEKKAIADEIQRIDDAVQAIDHAEAAADTIDQLPETVEPDDEDTAEDILAAKKAYEELTDHEKTLVEETLKEKLDALVAALTDYDIVTGDGDEWTADEGGSLSFTANGPFSKFTGIKVDGKHVDPQHYEAKSGSTIITLKESFMNTLSDGEHTITVVYTDGETAGTFQTSENTSEPEAPNAGGTGIPEPEPEETEPEETEPEETEPEETEPEETEPEETEPEETEPEETESEETEPEETEPEETEPEETEPEETKPEETKPEETEPEETEPEETKPDASSPETGDDSNIMFWTFTMLASTAALAALLGHAKKRKTAK